MMQLTYKITLIFLTSSILGIDLLKMVPILTNVIAFICQIQLSAHQVLGHGDGSSVPLFIPKNKKVGQKNRPRVPKSEVSVFSN